MYHSISENKNDLILCAWAFCFNSSDELIKEVMKKCWPIEFESLWENISVCIKYTCYSRCFTEVYSVIYFSCLYFIWSNCSKSNDWELFVTVILFNNAPNTPYCLLILIELRFVFRKVMKRCRSRGVTVRSSEINCNIYWKLPSRLKEMKNLRVWRKGICSFFIKVNIINILVSNVDFSLRFSWFCDIFLKCWIWRLKQCA